MEDKRLNEFLNAIQIPWVNLILRYGGAILGVIVAFWLYGVITAWFGPGLPTYILFYPVVIVVALLAGFGPGLLATVLAVMVAGIWILPPYGEFTIEPPINLVGAVLFGVMGVLISGMAELYHRNRIKAAEYDKEMALRETQREKEFLANILEHASQPFAVGYLDGQLGILNNAFEQLTGYTAEELRNIDWSVSLTPRKWWELEKQKLDELHRTGQPVRYEKEYIRKDGSRVPIELLVHMVSDAEGKPEYYYSFITNITERKQAEEEIRRLLEKSQQLIEELEVSNEELQETTEELHVSNEELRHQGEELIIINEKLRQSDERFRLAQQAANIGTFEWNIQSGVNTWTPELEAMYGLPPGGFGGTQEAWEKLVYPVDFSDIQKLVEYTLETGKAVEGDWRVIWPDGSIHWLFGRFKAFKDNLGNPTRMTGVNIDITERKKLEEELKDARDNLEEKIKDRTIELEEAYESLKESEESYQILFNSIDEGFCVIEVIFDADNNPVDYRFLEVNPAFEEQTGLINAKGKLMRELAPKHEEHWFEIYGQIALTGEPKRFMNPAEALDRWYDVYAFKVGDPESREVAILFNDITIIKKTEKELKNTITDLERSNKELESFAYITSHDLQEPLRSIASYAQLIERRYGGQLDSDADEFLEFMVSGAARMKQQIQGLLEYSRVGTKGDEYRDFNAEEALNHSLTNLRSAIEECHAEVTHESLPVIFADKSQITRVFQNLIGNALKFRREGVQPKVHIKARKEGNEYIFSVQDNGIGIEKQYTDRIFGVFKRLHAIGKYKGTGIGLAIVKRIIEHHNGRIWVESELGKGSTFYFTISFESDKNGGIS